MRCRKFLFAAAVVIAVVLAAVSLFACNPKGGQTDAQLRQNGANAVRDAALFRMNEQWQGELDDEELKQLDNAGEYVVAFGWAQFAADVLKNSSLQTAKLNNLAAALNSEEADKLFENFEGNAELLFPLLRTVGFTQSDVSGLMYDLVTALVNGGTDVLDAAYTRLQALLASKGLKQSVRDRLTASRNSVNSMRMYLTSTLTTSKKREILDAVSSSRGAIEALTAFAYNMSVNLINDDLNSAIFGAGSGEGALANMTDGELMTILNALLSNVTTLKSAISGGNIDKLSNAITLIISAFDSAYVNSALYSEIVTYAKYANMIVGVLPTLLDVVGYAGQRFSEEGFVSDFRRAFTVSGETDEQTQNLRSFNLTILLSKMFLTVMDNYDVEALSQAIEEVRDASYFGGTFDAQKAAPLIALDLTLNVSFLVGEGEGDLEDNIVVAHPEVWGVGEDGVAALSTLIRGIAFPFAFERFRQAYYEFCVGAKTQGDYYRLINAANSCNFGDFGVVNKWGMTQYNFDDVCEGDKTFLEAWYDYYAVTGLAEVNKVIQNTLSKAAEDVNLFIEEYYDGGKDALEKFSERPLFESPEDFTEDVYKDIAGSGMLGVTFIVMLLMAL